MFDALIAECRDALFEGEESDAEKKERKAKERARFSKKYKEGKAAKVTKRANLQSKYRVAKIDKRAVKASRTKALKTHVNITSATEDKLSARQRINQADKIAKSDVGGAAKLHQRYGGHGAFKQHGAAEMHKAKGPSIKGSDLRKKSNAELTTSKGR